MTHRYDIYPRLAEGGGVKRPHFFRRAIAPQLAISGPPSAYRHTSARGP